MRREILKVPITEIQMKARLYCEHCEKYYDVPLKDVRLVQEANSGRITFSHNTYYYEEGCFFKTVNSLKQIDHETGESA
jgi:hypothetical protein